MWMHPSGEIIGGLVLRGWFQTQKKGMPLLGAAYYSEYLQNKERSIFSVHSLFKCFLWSTCGQQICLFRK